MREINSLRYIFSDIAGFTSDFLIKLNLIKKAQTSENALPRSSLYGNL